MQCHSDIRALQVPSAFDTRWSRKSHRSRSLNGYLSAFEAKRRRWRTRFNSDVYPRATAIFVSSPIKMPISTAATWLPPGNTRSRLRSSADFRAGFTLFRSDRVSLSGPPLEHCGDTVLAESFARDAPNMKFAAEINLLVRVREVSRGFIARQIARLTHYEVRCHACKYQSILNEDRYGVEGKLNCIYT